MLPVDQLTALGYSVAIFPNSMTRVIASVGKALYQELARNGSSAAFSDRMVDHRTLWNLFEYPAFMELESRYVDPAAAIEVTPGFKP
jgi:2-methylisocitrate lyase-like PEP mutase family enzyme